MRTRDLGGGGEGRGRGRGRGQGCLGSEVKWRNETKRNSERGSWSFSEIAVVTRLSLFSMAWLHAAQVSSLI